MKRAQRRRLERAGWKVGSPAELLALSREDEAFIETKLALSRGLRQRRERLELTQADLATRLGSSQSRVAKMETGDASVSIDLLVRSLLALGLTRRGLARLIASANSKDAA